jgi:SAM-dependent methyltransferase
MNWESLDWEVLDRLRETFLSEAKTVGPYWHTITDLECYDLTYGERIGWKWDAVLSELRLRGWTPPGGATVLDWGCGSGVAGRRVVRFFDAGNFSRLALHDHSSLAVDYAEHAARKVFPSLTVERAGVRFLRANEPIGVLVLSHVLNELDDAARAGLAELLARAQTVLWVEPGTHEVSRALIGWREEWRGRGFCLAAPCPHQSACGMFTAGNERHWCHFFASPPPAIFADSQWVKFGQRAGIDLRALPYSFLVLDRRPQGSSRHQTAVSSGVTTAAKSSARTDISRIIGGPRLYKGYAKIFNCSERGVEELTLQQRADKTLFKSLKRASGSLLYRWTREGVKITGAKPALPGSPTIGTD